MTSTERIIHILTITGPIDMEQLSRCYSKYPDKFSRYKNTKKAVAKAIGAQAIKKSDDGTYSIKKRQVVDS